MPDLIKQSSKKSDTPSAADERVDRSRTGFASFNAAMAQQSTVKAEASTGPRVFVSGFGGASNLPEAKPLPISSKKAEAEELPEAVRRIRHRLSAEGARFLGAVVRRSEEENGAPISFSSDDVISITGLSRQKAQALAEALIRDGVLIPRTGRAGDLEGYTVNLPKA